MSDISHLFITQANPKQPEKPMKSPLLDNWKSLCNTGSVVEDLHIVWLKDYRGQIEGGMSLSVVIAKLRAHRAEQCEASRMNMAATIDAVIAGLEHDDAMLGA